MAVVPENDPPAAPPTTPAPSTPAPTTPAPTPPPPTSDKPTDRVALDIARIPADAGQLRLLRKISGPRDPGFSVVIQRSALDAVHAHGQTDTAVEICGVLVGELCHDRISPYLLISAQIPGEKAASKQTQVTFTADTWNAIQARMEKDFVGKQIVGWYHTHPGFGVFLSGMDLFIQDNFFNLPHQVAWVYDPIAETDGAFVWRLGQSEKVDFLVEEDQGERTHDFRSKLPESKRPSVVASRRAKTARVLVTALVFAGFFLATWFVMGWLKGHGFRIRLPIEW